MVAWRDASTQFTANFSGGFLQPKPEFVTGQPIYKGLDVGSTKLMP